MHDIEPGGRGSSAANPLTWQQAQRAAWSADLVGPPAEVVVRAIVVTCLAFLAAGVVGGIVWSAWADPPAYHVFPNGPPRMDEEEAGRQFGVDVVFALVGLGTAVLVGFVTGWRWHRVGWPLVLAVTGAAGVAGIIAWRLGMILGPDDPATVVGSAQVGDDIPEQLELHADGLLAIWPIGGLAGLILAVLLFSRPSHPGRYQAGADPDAPSWRSAGSDPGRG